MKEKDFHQTVLSEVNEHSPLLAEMLVKIKRRPLPDGYFDDMQQSVLSQINDVESELIGISPAVADLLLKHDKTGLPEKYFEKMQSSVLEKINITEEKTKLIPLNKSMNARIWLAAASTIGILLLSVLFLIPKKESQSMDLAKLDQSEISEYLLNHAEDLDDDHLDLLPSNISNAELLDLNESDLKPILDEYLYQIEPALN